MRSDPAVTIGEPYCWGGHPLVDYADPRPVPEQYTEHVAACPSAPPAARDAARKRLEATTRG